jgi:hypothetical protein
MQGSSENAGKLLYNKRLRIDALPNIIRADSARESSGREATGSCRTEFKIKSQGV